MLSHKLRYLYFEFIKFHMYCILIYGVTVWASMAGTTDNSCHCHQAPSKNAVQKKFLTSVLNSFSSLFFLCTCLKSSLA